jgi:hypothetical protein
LICSQNFDVSEKQLIVSVTLSPKKLVVERLDDVNKTSSQTSLMPWVTCVFWNTMLWLLIGAIIPSPLLSATVWGCLTVTACSGYMDAKKQFA